MTQAHIEHTRAQKLAEHLECFRSFPDDLAAAAELRRLDAAEQAHMRELRAYRLTVENLEKQLNDILSVSDEMVDAALEAYMPFGDMRLAIEAAIASVSR